MEREAVLVGIDVGTSKVCALIGEVSRDGRLTIMGHGTVPASGLKKGVVINIDQTVRSIADAVEKAERLSGWKIDRAFVGVGGQHVESLNSPGQVAVTATWPCELRLSTCCPPTPTNARSIFQPESRSARSTESAIERTV